MTENKEAIAVKNEVKEGRSHSKNCKKKKLKLIRHEGRRRKKEAKDKIPQTIREACRQNDDHKLWKDLHVPKNESTATFYGKYHV